MTNANQKAIVAYLKMLMDAIKQVETGSTPPLMVLDASMAQRLTGPITVDGIAATADWQAYWPRADAKRRQSAPWANPPARAQPADARAAV